MANGFKRLTRVKKIKKQSDKQKLRAFFQETLADRRTAAPACRHFGVCGGCEFQDVPYPDQLDAKLRAVRFIADAAVSGLREQAATLQASDKENAAADAETLGAKADRLESVLAEARPSIVPSPLPLGYRQRMDYVYAFGQAGLRRANRHRQVVELEECPLLGDRAFAVFRKAKRMAEAAGLESYNYMRHTGELRYFVVRQSRDGQILLSLVTKSRGGEQAVMAILNRLVADGDITSGHWLLAEGLGDVSFGVPLGVAGERWIVETMNGVRLRIGPNTFFQSNPAVAEQAYAAIRDFCPPGGQALDMYSGVGSIALSIAPGAGEVVAVENVPENVELARANLADNPSGTVRLVLEDSALHLRQLADDASAPRPDLVVVNPPRAGVENGGMAALERLGPGRIAYLSCNPFTLFRNLADILGNYRLESLTVYDMFPQTRHFESLALLKRT